MAAAEAARPPPRLCRFSIVNAITKMDLIFHGFIYRRSYRQSMADDGGIAGRWRPFVNSRSPLPRQAMTTARRAAVDIGGAHGGRDWRIPGAARLSRSY